MATKNSRYWAARFQQLEESQHQSSEKLVEDIQYQMCKAEAAIENKINAWHGRLAANNNVSMAEARKLLNNRELEEFRWEVEDYIHYGEKNAINGQWVQQLENASARVHISRLEQLKLQVQQEAEKLYGNYLDQVDGHMKSLYEEGSYRTAYEIQRGVGVGWNLTGVDSGKLEKIIRKPWAADGKNFSDRIWSSKLQLIDSVHTALTQMCILGQSPDKAIASLAKAMKTSKNQAGRLVMTESAFFSSEAQKDCFKELDVEEYEIVATLDSHTSEICQMMDGKHFPMSEFKAGATAPPFHVWCRSCTCPYFDDEFSGGKRAARGENGKTYYVDSKMTYPEWKKTFVNSGEQMTLKGLSANEKNNSDVPIHDNPVILGEVDFFDKDVIISTIKEYESKITESSIENAVVVTRQGKVVQCFGDLNGVYPDTDLGSELEGAFVTHNHPRGSDNEYSFSDLDIQLFMEQKLEILRGIDEKYIYELTRNSVNIDEHISLFELTEEDGRHEQVIEIAHQYGIGYRRWRR